MTDSRLEVTTRGIALTWTLVALLAAPTLAATYTVGADGSCTHPTISAALFAAAFSTDPDAIILARNQPYTDEFLHLTNFGPGGSGALQIIGGHATCDSGYSGGHTEIDGLATESTIEIDTTGGGQSDVTLLSLRIVGSGVRGVKVEGDSMVFIRSSIIESNGGGINLEPGAEVDIDFFTTVANNRGGFGQGGGIRCWGGTVRLSGVVIDNLAEDGGGLFLGNSCQVVLRGGALLVSNDATRGGGIFAANADLDTEFQVTEPIAVDFNTATDRGGGIYASSFAFVTLHNASVSDNQAGTTAGGVYSSQACVILAPELPCDNPARCRVTLARNSLTTGDQGVAARVDSGFLDVDHALVAGNTTPAVGGSLFQVVGSGSILELGWVALWDNQGPDALVLAESGAIARVEFVSASANISTGAIPARPLVLTGAATGRLEGSIFWPNSPVLPGDGTLNVYCLIVSDPTNLPAGAQVSTVDPLFRNAVGGDFHLRVESPAVDYCDEIPGDPSLDFDMEPRPYDHLDSPNGSPGVPGGIYDIGLDEVHHFFFDGFESGDTSAW